jgi:hypothetical protein
MFSKLKHPLDAHMQLPFILFHSVSLTIQRHPSDGLMWRFKGKDVVTTSVGTISTSVSFVVQPFFGH